MFDWDGTLLDSMATKLRTFSEVLADTLAPLLGSPAAELTETCRARYHALSGAPRREIAETIASELGLSLSARVYDAFNLRLSEVNRRELARAPLFPDALDFLRALSERRVTKYISSSVPQAELDDLVDGHLPDEVRKDLAGVFGSDGPFTKGTAHVARILTELGCDKEQLLCFGDDWADVELCRAANVDCILIDRDARFADRQQEVLRLVDFQPLCAQLSEVK